MEKTTSQKTGTQTVELFPAYCWNCEDCGRENVAYGIVPELTDEELAELRAEHGVSEFDTGYMSTIPTNVTCKHCKASFSAKYFK